MRREAVTSPEASAWLRTLMVLSKNFHFTSASEAGTPRKWHGLETCCMDDVRICERFCGAENALNFSTSQVIVSKFAFQFIQSTTM